MVMEEALAILAKELGLTIEQLTAEIKAACQAIEEEAKNSPPPPKKGFLSHA